MSYVVSFHVQLEVLASASDSMQAPMVYIVSVPFISFRMYNLQWLNFQYMILCCQGFDEGTGTYSTLT